MITFLDSFSVLTPAKTNFFLGVKEFRIDKFHNLVSLIGCISIYDSLFFTFTKKLGFYVYSDNPRVPNDYKNLVAKSLSLFSTKLFFKGINANFGISIYIKKKFL